MGKVVDNENNQEDKAQKHDGPATANQPGDLLKQAERGDSSLSRQKVNEILDQGKNDRTHILDAKNCADAAHCAESLKKGDIKQLQISLTDAYARTGGQFNKFAEFGKELEQQLKGSQIGVSTNGDDRSISFQRDSDKITFNMRYQLDASFKNGKYVAQASASSDGQSTSLANVENAFSGAGTMELAALKTQPHTPPVEADKNIEVQKLVSASRDSSLPLVKRAESAALSGDSMALRDLINEAFKDRPGWKQFQESFAEQMKLDGITVKTGGTSLALHKADAANAVLFEANENGEITPPQVYDWVSKDTRRVSPESVSGDFRKASLPDSPKILEASEIGARFDAAYAAWTSDHASPLVRQFQRDLQASFAHAFAAGDMKAVKQLEAEANKASNTPGMGIAVLQLSKPGEPMQLQVLCGQQLQPGEALAATLAHVPVVKTPEYGYVSPREELSTGTITESGESAALNGELRSLSEKMNANDAQLFMHDVKQFESRSELSPGEIQETLRVVAELLEQKSAIGVSDQDRELAAKTLMLHLADPDTIWQGYHNTCNVTALQHVLMMRTPSLISGMLKDALIKGEWTGPDGQTIKTNPSGVFNKAQPEEAKYPPINGMRSMATEVLNIALLNDIGQHYHEPMTYNESAGPYLSTDAQPATWRRMSDGKEFDYMGKSFDSEGEIPAWMLAEETARLTGQKDALLIDKSQAVQFHVPEQDAAKDGSNSGDVRYLSDEDFQRIDGVLNTLKSTGRLPAIIGVDSTLYAQTFSPGYDDPVNAINHYVSVDDYRQGGPGQDGWIKIRGEWGQGRSEGWIRSSELRKMMARSAQKTE